MVRTFPRGLYEYPKDKGVKQLDKVIDAATDLGGFAESVRYKQSKQGDKDKVKIFPPGHQSGHHIVDIKMAGEEVSEIMVPMYYLDNLRDAVLDFINQVDKRTPRNTGNSKKKSNETKD